MTNPLAIGTPPVVIRIVSFRFGPVCTLAVCCLDTTTAQGVYAGGAGAASTLYNKNPGLGEVLVLATRARLDLAVDVAMVVAPVAELTPERRLALDTGVVP